MRPRRGPGEPRAVAGCVAIAMGLNLLGLLPLTFPSLALDVRSAPLPPAAVAYLAGLTFALAASPCTTPILATLLAYVAAQDAPAAGAPMLFLYSCGYVAPLLAAATATVRHPARCEQSSIHSMRSAVPCRCHNNAAHTR
jgi:cytochrome c-type biogenesis protein